MEATLNPTGQKIALVTDSCSDLTEEQRRGAPIFILPLHIRCGEQEFSDGIDITASDVYQRLQAGELPKTSLPDGGSVTDLLDHLAEEGYQKVIAVHLSAGVSGTYNMVRLQGEGREDLEVAVFDSVSASMGLGSIMLQLWNDIQSGMSWDTLIHTRVPQLIAHTHVFFSIDTLEYLQKGGRIGKIAAFTGTMLNIKPIISFAPDGQLAAVAKARGRKAAQDAIFKRLESLLRPGVPYNLGLVHSGTPQELEAFRCELQARFPDHVHLWVGELDATLSVYLGPGSVGAGIQLLSP